jgi:hypothetical protein
MTLKDGKPHTRHITHCRSDTGPQFGSILDRPVVGYLHFHFRLQGIAGKHLLGFVENLPQP